MTKFADFSLHSSVLRALQVMRFHAPSPIQRSALPIALFGNDLIAQAKSGTGKTAVFGITAIEHVLSASTSSVDIVDPMVLILAPTREIAVQIETVLRQLAAFVASDQCITASIIGGLAIAHDYARLRESGCHVAVGTPGRVKALIEQNVLRCHAIRLLVLDEVDKLMASDFEQELDTITRALPERRQTMAFSATYTSDQLVLLAGQMRTPQVVRVRSPDDVTVEFIESDQVLEHWEQQERAQTSPEMGLRQVKQFYAVVTPAASSTTSDHDPLGMKRKIRRLAELLSNISFDQCIVFCNDKFRAEALATALCALGWPAACITGSQTQATRLEVMEKFRSYRSRVLVSTDLTARGIDIDRVNFVVNLDLPRDPATYLHRVGRTGRFGGKGVAISLVNEEDVPAIQVLAQVFSMTIQVLPEPVPHEILQYTASSAKDSIDTAPQMLDTHVPLITQQEEEEEEEEEEEAEEADQAFAWEERCYEDWLLRRKRCCRVGS